MRCQMNTIWIYISVLLSSISAQEFISPTNLKAYVNKSDEVLLSWKIDFKDKKLNFASIQQLDKNNNPELAIITWNKPDNPFVFRKQDELRVNGFANVTLIKLNPTRDIAFLLSVEFEDLSTVKDTVYFIYYQKAPVFTKRLPALSDFSENDPTNKDLVYSVTSSGNPNPEMYWFLNDVDVNKINGMNLSCTSSKVENDFITDCELFVSKFDVSHNGSLKVVTKFGKLVEISPQDETVMAIDIKFPPAEPVLKSDLPTDAPYVIKNANITLICNADANPQPNYTFIQVLSDGLKRTLHRGTEKSFVLNLRPTDGRDAFHRFICTVENTLGLKTSEEHSIFVKAGKSVSVENESPRKTTVLENSPQSKKFSLIFKIRALPAVSVNCYINKQPFVRVMSMSNTTHRLFKLNDTPSVLKRTKDEMYYEFHLRLMIRELLISDNSGVLCKVLNEDGSVRMEFREPINVLYSPRKILLSTNNTNKIINEEGFVVFTCNVQANPKPTYIFKSQHGILYRGKNPIYIRFLDQYQKSSTLDVRCDAMNEHGNISSNTVKLKFNNETMVKTRPEEKKESTEWTLYLALGVCVGVFVIVAIMAGTFVFQKRQRGAVALS